MIRFGRAAGAMVSVASTFLLFVACALLPLSAAAQATAGRACSIVIPDVAQTASF